MIEVVTDPTFSGLDIPYLRLLSFSESFFELDYGGHFIRITREGSYPVDKYGECPEYFGDLQVHRHAQTDLTRMYKFNLHVYSKEGDLFHKGQHRYSGESDSEDHLVRDAIFLYREQLSTTLYQTFKHKLQRIFNKSHLNVELDLMRSEDLLAPITMGCKVNISTPIQSFPEFSIVLGKSFRTGIFLSRLGVVHIKWIGDGDSLERVLTETALEVSRLSYEWKR